MNQRQLNSWKEIAVHLGYSVRTVQRWEKERGLPVGRIPGERGAVYGLADELDQWKLSARAPKPGEEDPALLALEAEPSDAAHQGVDASRPTIHPGASRPRSRAVMAIGAGVVVTAAIVAAVWFYRDRTAPAAAETSRGFAIVVGPTAVEVGGLDEGPWPIRGGDMRRSQRTSLPGPRAPVVVGTLAVFGKGEPPSDPMDIDDLVVDASGLLIVGGCGFVEALDRDGATAWQHRFAQEKWDTERPAGVALTTGRRVMIGTRGCPPHPLHTRRARVYGFGQQGSVMWSQTQGGVSRSPAVWPNGNIAWIDEFNTLRAYDAAGALQWTTDLAGFGHGAMAIGVDGNLYIGTDASLYHQRSLWSVAPDGGIRWSQGAGSFGTPAITPDGAIYVPNWPAGVKAFTSAGEERWSTSVPEFQGDAPLSIADDGTLYVRSKQMMTALTPNGATRWSMPLPGGAITSAALVDADGHLYVAGRDEVVAMDPTGAVVWRARAPGAQRVVIGGPGRLYVLADNRTVFTITSQTP